MMTLSDVLQVLDPATSIEIAQWHNDERVYYCGLMLNLTYCDVEKVLKQQVRRIMMKNDEHGHRVFIEIS